MSLLQLIEITRRSFETSTAAINTIGQNIANEHTEGYRRRRVDLNAESYNGPGVIIGAPLDQSYGLGVSLQSIDRVRDQLLASSTWEARSGLGASDEESRLLSAIENLFPANSPGSLDNVLNEFWNAWNDLSNDPADLGIRQTLISRAGALSDTFNRLGTDLDRLENQAVNDLTARVDDFNSKLLELADLNEQIQAQRSRGTPDLAAEDLRDRIVSELAEIAPIHVEETELHTFNITVNSKTVLQGRDVSLLTLDTGVNPPTLTYGGTGLPYNPPAGDDGRIGAILRTLNQTIPDARGRLDDLVDTLVTRVNAIHSTGFGLDGVTGRNFFDPAGLAAGTMAVSDDISEGRFIAASSDPDATATGNNDIAFAILNERTVQQATLNGSSFEGHLIDTVSSIGGQLETVNGQFEGHLAVVNYLDALDRGVSGVSVNEELTDLIQYQQSFAAAARVLNSAQVMMDTLLTI